MIHYKIGNSVQVFINLRSKSGEREGCGVTALLTYKIELLTVFHDCRVGIRFESKFTYLSLKA